MKPFTVDNAQWIWVDSSLQEDSYADFEFDLDYSKGKAILELSCDGNYAVYVNGSLAGFGQYPDFPYYKILEQEDLTRYLNKGYNKIKISVWRQGVAASTYYVAPSGLLFRLTVDGVQVESSGEHILCRYNRNYLNGYKKYITPQLGLSFWYDATAKSDELKRAVKAYKSYEFYPRPVKKLVLGDRLESSVDKSGIVDLGEERVGFLDLEFYSKTKQKITISFAEHLTDGKVARRVGVRDFSVEYTAKSGQNAYLNPFLRIGGRYLQIECEQPVDIKYIGLRSVSYPFEQKPAPNIPAKYAQIYQMCINTLNLCAHDHYEDNPWREQSMYVLDSRNQMLCGYYCFNGYEYQRASLVTIAKSQMKNGLLPICAPSSKTMAIPSFSLFYPVAVKEYIEHTGDQSILQEVYDVCASIINVFINAIDGSGLIPQLPKPCWNFYEWSKHSEGYYRESPDREENIYPHYDLLLNTLFIYSLNAFSYLAKKAGKSVDFDTKPLKTKIKEFFRKGDRYVLGDYTDLSSMLGNGMVILADIEEDNSFLERQIKEDKGLVDITLSMTAFLYDALLKVSAENKEYILNDISDKYGYMLEKGSKTCWETILGEVDFDNAGSLCHGWSALPIYYLNKFFG